MIGDDSRTNEWQFLCCAGLGINAHYIWGFLEFTIFTLSWEILNHSTNWIVYSARMGFFKEDFKKIVLLDWLLHK